MYNYIALWIRLLWIFIISTTLIIIILFFTRKYKLWEKAIAIVLSVLLVIVGGGNTIRAIFEPKIETVKACYISECRRTSLSPLEIEYCFFDGNNNIYLDLDVFSKKVLYKETFEKNINYIIAYEKNTNLILYVNKE